MKFTAFLKIKGNVDTQRDGEGCILREETYENIVGRQPLQSRETPREKTTVVHSLRTMKKYVQKKKACL